MDWPLALGLILLLIPVPSGLTATAWHYFTLFAAVIAALIMEPLPGPAVGFIGVTIAAMVAVPSVPIRPVTLMLVYSLGLMGVITPYATGPAPIWYGSGYIADKDFWRQGFIMGVVYLAVLLLVGMPFVLRFA